MHDAQRDSVMDDKRGGGEDYWRCFVPAGRTLLLEAINQCESCQTLGEGASTWTLRASASAVRQEFSKMMPTLADAVPCYAK